MQMRVLELAKLGFEHVVIPKDAPNLGLRPKDLGGLRVVRRPTLLSALEFCFGASNLNIAAKVERKQMRQQQHQQHQQPAASNRSGYSRGRGTAGAATQVAIDRTEPAAAAVVAAGMWQHCWQQ